MQPESLTRVLAGSLVLLGVVLTALVSRWWVLLAAFAGANLRRGGRR
jgi:preprotein translocase subunit Sec63